MLYDLLKEKKCFKLVCAAGNEDEKEVEKLVTLYSKAGCNIFDLCAKREIIEAAKRGLKKAGIKEKKYLCVSVGIKGDPHFKKIRFDKKKCSLCLECKEICPQGAIEKKNENLSVKNEKCIGCLRCLNICKNCAIKSFDVTRNLKEILSEIKKNDIDYIEFHILSKNKKEIKENWKILNAEFDGILGFCTDRSKMSDEELIKLSKELLKSRKPHTTILQADGAPMSGGKNDFRTTLQAIATAELFQKENLPIFTLISGGTNSKSSRLAKICNVSINGVAIGSYARKIVKKYIDREDFLTNNKTFNEALKIAKKLVNDTLKYMN